MTSALSIRGRLAQKTPGFVRKAVRMIEHYGRRHVEWAQVLREMSGSSGKDKFVFGMSALAAPLTSLRRMDGFEPPRLLGDISVDAAGAGQFELRNGTDDIIHVLSAREPEVRTAIESNLQAGDVFVDAGANIGFFSVLASRAVGNGGQVIAFEMMPATAHQLKRHLTINNCSNAHIVEKALSAQSGETIRAVSSAKKFGQASIVPVAEQAGDIVCDVETVTLDDALRDVGEIAVMKMDLEGAEIPALEGASEVLSRTKVLIFENNSGERTIPDMLEARGFVVENLDGNNCCARRR